MSPLLVGLLAIVVLFVLFFLRIPIGYAMLAVGFAGYVYLVNWEGALGMIASVPYRTTTNYVMAVIPLFLFMSELASYTGLSESAFNVSYKWLGRLPGGLAVATVGACTAFAAICGDTVAAAATMSKIALPEMRKYKYDDQLSIGCIAAGSNLGILIPPSLIFVVYGVLVEESIGKLFLAGIVPGVLLAITFIIQIIIISHMNPRIAPTAPMISWKERVYSLRGIWGILLLFLVVIGGIYFGIFTATEAGAIGAFLTIVMGLINRRLKPQGFTTALLSTGRTTAMIFLLFIGALTLNSFLAVTRLPFELAAIISELPVPAWGIMAAILIFYIILGFFMPIGAMVVLTVPILYPVIIALGFDGIWFGVMIVLMVCVGSITPPVGLTIFAMTGIIRDTPMFTIFRAAWPFVYSMVAVVILCAIFPQISLFLINLLR